MKPNKILAALIILSVMVCSTTTFAQLYKTDFTTKIVLTNSGFPTNPTFMVSLTAPAGMPGPYSLILPTTAGNTGEFLTAGPLGQLTWTNPASGINLIGDVNGPLNANVVNKINGNPLGSTAAVGGNVLLNDGTNWVSTTLGGDVTVNSTGVTAIGTNKVLNSMFRQSGAFTLVGNSTNATANVADITLDPTLTFTGSTLAIDLTHNNNWTGIQTITGAGKFIYADGNQGLSKVGWVLTEDINGVAAWTDPSTSVTLAGDVIGAAGANTIAPTLQAGTNIVNALNTQTTLATKNTMNADVLKYDATLQVTGNNLGINLANNNSWNSMQTFTGASNGITVASTADFIYAGHNAADGYVLTYDNATGKAKWTDPGVGVTLTGDVNGPANANVVNKINGNPLGSTAAVGGNVLLNDGTNWVSTTLGGDVTVNSTGVTAIGTNKVLNSMFRQSGAFTLVGNSTNATANVADITLDPTLTFTGSTLAIDLTHNNNWTGIQTITGAGKFIYADGNQGLSKVGWVLTEDINGVAAWTDPSTSVTLAGDVIGAAGANTIAPTLQAGTNIVNALNTQTTLATKNTMNADVLKYDATLQVGTVAANQLGLDLTHGNTWTGAQEFGTMAQTAGAIAAASDISLASSNSMYKITGTGTIDGFGNGTPGRLVTITKTDGGFITLSSGTGLAGHSLIIPGGDPVYMGQNATVTLQYDGVATGWRLISGF